MTTVREIGEQGLLQRIQAFCPAGVIGDDAALLSVSPGRSLVVTEDMLVDGVHFSTGMARAGIVTTTPADAGWRAVAANLSDLAAMGATPLGITVGLGLPGELPVDWVEDLYRGMTDCLQCYSTAIVGGDICRSPVLTVAIAAFGEVLPDRAIRRSTAQPGDVILVTGPHGGSRAGLELLLHPERSAKLTESDRAALIRAHQRPLPRLDLLPLLDPLLDLLPLSPSPPPPSLSGMDSSDGLADAIVQICRASQWGAWVDRSQIPMPPAFDGWLSPEQAIDWALYGGEDFELILCLPPNLATQLLRQLPGGAIVGSITESPDVVLYDPTGQFPDQLLTLERGFQHFQPE